MGAAKGSWYSLVVPARVLIILMDFITVHANSASWPPTFGTEIPIFTIVVPVWWETVRGFMERSIQWLVRMRCLRIVVVSCRINGIFLLPFQSHLLEYWYPSVRQLRKICGMRLLLLSSVPVELMRRKLLCKSADRLGHHFCAPIMWNHRFMPFSIQWRWCGFYECDYTWWTVEEIHQSCMKGQCCCAIESESHLLGSWTKIPLADGHCMSLILDGGSQ